MKRRFTDAQRRSAADADLGAGDALELGALEGGRLLELVDLAARDRLARVPGDRVARHGVLAGEGDGADLEPRDGEVLADGPDHRVRGRVVELLDVEVADVGLEAHQPVLDQGGRVGLLDEALDLLRPLDVDVRVVVVAGGGGRVAGDLERLEARVERRLLGLEDRLVLEQGHEAEVGGLRPGVGDELQVAEVDRVDLVRLVPARGVDDAGLAEQVEGLLAEAGLEGLDDEVAVADHVVAAPDLLGLGRTGVVDRDAVGQDGEDLHVLERPEAEVEPVVLADDVPDLQRAVAALDDAGVGDRLAAALVGAAGDVHHRARVLDERPQHVQHVVVRPGRLEPRAEEPAPAREGVAHHVPGGALLAVGEGVAGALGDDVVAALGEQLLRQGAVAAEEGERAEDLHRGRPPLVAHGGEGDVLLDLPAVHRALDAEGGRGGAGLDEEGGRALVEGAGVEGVPRAPDDLGGRADDADHLAGVRRREGEVDARLVHAAGALGDLADRRAEVGDVRDVLVHPGVAGLGHEAREELGVVPVAVPDHREGRALVRDRLGGDHGVGLLLLEAGAGRDGAAVGEEHAEVLRGLAGQRPDRADHQLEGLGEHGGRHDLHVALDGGVDHAAAGLVAPGGADDAARGVLAREDDDADEVVGPELRDVPLRVTLHVVEDPAHAAGAVQEQGGVGDLGPGLRARGLDLEEDAVTVVADVAREGLPNLHCDLFRCEATLPGWQEFPDNQGPKSYHYLVILSIYQLSIVKPPLRAVVRWRRGWDSNPRYRFAVRRISSPVHSTALPPLRGAKNNQNGLPCRECSRLIVSSHKWRDTQEAEGAGLLIL